MSGAEASQGGRRELMRRRVHDSPAEGKEDVTFHSIFTDEVKKDDKEVAWKGIQTKETPLEWFSE